MRSEKKQQIIIQAGHLFAEHGFDKVTTRMIADEANVNLSAIHYYFDSKEALYVAAFEHAHNKDAMIDFMAVLEENPELGKTPEGQAQIICQTVKRYFQSILDPTRPFWERQILIREVVSPSTALPALAKNFIHSLIYRSEKFCAIIRPGMDPRDRAIWADTLIAHLFLYTLAEKQIEAVRGRSWLSEEFFDRTSNIIARYMIRELSLPLPSCLEMALNGLVTSSPSSGLPLHRPLSS